MEEYNKLKRSYLKEHDLCQACMKLGKPHARASKEIHHARGRIRRLLVDTRFWIAICRECHDYLHDHPATGRRLGLIAPATEYNVYPG